MIDLLANRTGMSSAALTTSGAATAVGAAPIVAKRARELLFVTDLDGCLLDERTYSHEAAHQALSALAQGQITLVLASGKTRAEMEPLARKLGLSSPLIVENGAAILIPRGDGTYDAIARSQERPELAVALNDIARETTAPLRGFSSLTLDELQRLTGLGSAAARRALEREHDEAFLLADHRKAPAVVDAAERRCLRVTRGARFYHLTGATDKGRALRELVTLFARRGRRFTTVGLGDAPQDVPLLRAVDRPIVIPRRGRRMHPDLQQLTWAERAPAPGPTGWNAAVLTVLEGGRLASVRGRCRA